MQKISVSIPTIIKNPKTHKPKRKEEVSSSVVIFQHNDLVEARYFLTLQEKRLILWLISQIKPTDENFKKHKLSVQEFMDLMELTGKANYKELQKITLGLMKKVLVIKKPLERTLTQVNWINYAHYQEGTGRIELAFSDVMKPFLLHLKSKFTHINVTDLMQFKSIHAIRIYELLKQYENIGERILTIEEIKACCGVENKLKQYSHFEQKILLIAQREINKKSDIKFDYERKKEGRKIIAIKFIISKNKAYQLKNKKDDDIQEINRRPPLYDILKEYDLSTQMIKKFLKEYESKRIEDAINAVEVQIKKGTVRNPKAMLVTAIKEEWCPDVFKKGS